MFKVNPPENVKTVFADRLTESMIEKVNTHKAFADRFFNDDHFQKDVIALMMDQVQKGFDLSDEKRILQMIAQGESTTMELFLQLDTADVAPKLATKLTPIFKQYR